METAEDLAIPFLQAWMIPPISRRAWSQAMEDFLPPWNLMSSLYIATVFPEKQQHTSLAAEADTALQLSSPPALGRTVSLLTAAGVVGSQKSPSGAQGLLCSRGHRKEANDRTGNHSRTAACSLDLPIWLSALSHLLRTWTRRGKFINSPAHWINLLWRLISQAASVADLKLGQHHRNHLEEQHPCNVGTCLSHRHFFMLTEEDLGCREGDMHDKWEVHTPFLLLMPGSTDKCLKLVPYSFCHSHSWLFWDTKSKAITFLIPTTASRSEGGSWSESVHQQLPAWGVPAAHTVTWHPAPSSLSVTDNNASQNQIPQVKRTF